MVILASLFARLEELYPVLVNVRRDLHMYPELSYQEVDTPQKVADYLRSLGLEVRTGVGGRGVVGWLRGGKAGRTVALRADFDALPIQDGKDVDYKSRVPGVMHAVMIFIPQPCLGWRACLPRCRSVWRAMSFSSINSRKSCRPAVPRR